MLIAVVVLGALLFLFFEFKPSGKEAMSPSPTTTDTSSRPAAVSSPKRESSPVATKKKEKPLREAPGPPSTTGIGTAGSPIRIYFAFNRAHVNKNVYCIFDRIQALVRREGTSDLRIVVEGNADSVGAPWYNVELSRRRAARVADSISNRLGLPMGSISLVANGSRKPIATNSTRAGRADNRRTDIIIYH